MPDPSSYIAEKLGQKVHRGAATLPQSAAAAIFTISGGRVLLNGIMGNVTVAIQNQACNTKLTANPTAATVASTDLCAVASIANNPVGTNYGISGTLSAALQIGGAVSVPPTPIILETGTIDLDCAASNTGSVEWDVWYLPLDAGAKIVAA
jgi:hypothetical protein